MKLWRRINRKLDRPVGAYTFALCSAVILYLILSHLGVVWKWLGALYSVISPVFIGLVIAYVLDPLVKFFEKSIFKKVRKHTTRKAAAVACTFIILITCIVVLLVALIPQLISSVKLFIGNLGEYSSQFSEMLEELQDFAAKHDVDISQYITMGNDLMGTIADQLPQSVNTVLNTTISYGVELFNGVISCIIAIYLLMDKDRLLKEANRLYRAITSERSYRKSNNFLWRCNSIMIRYIVCDLLDGLLIGVINAVFMLIVGLPYVPLISVVVGVTNLAPTFGPIVGCVIGAAILVLINPWYSLIFILFTIALQTTDGYVIKPKLFGGTLGVPSIWILISIIVFGRMLGVVGILLAIPFAAIIDFIYREEVLVKLEKRRDRLTKAAIIAGAEEEQDSDIQL